MRRQRGRTRFVGLMVGATFFVGFTLLERSISPEPHGDGNATGAPAARGAAPPSWEEAAADAPASVPNAAAAFPVTVRNNATTPADNTDAASTADATAATAPATDPAAEQTGSTGPTQTVEARPGDTPLKLLTRMGVAPDDAQAAVRQLSTVWNPRDLKAGQKAAVFVQSDRLLSIRLALAPNRDIVVARDDSGNFVAEDQDRPTHQVEALGTGTIHTSLSAAGSRANVPAGVLDEMVRAFSYDVDFQREVRPGDSFTVLYQRVDDEFDRPTSRGHLMYAEMVLSGTRLRLYRYTPKDGEPGYYNAIGENIRKSLLRTPIDGARLSSGFGMRFHPILGYSRMHEGVDFAAPIGTAVYAAGDGVVTRAGRVSGYGNYIEIEHAQQYATAYGHLSGFAANLREGEHVRQGEVIGYVGMTGLATGPHLHYEVHYQGAHIDPLSVKMPAMTRLAGDDLKTFQAARAAMELELNGLHRDVVAGVECRAGVC